MIQTAETPTVAVLNAPRGQAARAQWLAPGGTAEKLARVMRGASCVREVFACVPPGTGAAPAGARLLPRETERIQLEVEKLRQFSPAGFRDGILATTALDEGIDMPGALQAARETKAERVLFVPASSYFADPAQVELLLNTERSPLEDSTLRFTKAPLGFNLFTWMTDRVEHAVRDGRGPGAVFVYSNEAFTPDPTGTPACLPLPPGLAAAARAFRADTPRGLAYCRALETVVGQRGWQRGAMQAVLEAAAGQPDAWTGSLPRVLELEICSRSNLPRPALLPPRAPMPDMDPGLFRALVDEFAQAGDGVLLLGGHGEPLLHPQATELLAYAAARCPAVALATDGLGLNEALVQACIESGVAVVNLRLGNWGREAYASVNGRDSFEQAVAAGRLVVQSVAKSGRALPVLVPEVVKTPAGEATLEAFYDTYWPGPSWPVVRGHNHFCGRLPSLAAFTLLPRGRGFCRRLEEGLYVLPDGRAAMCAQDLDGDYAGTCAGGLAAAFGAAARQAARVAHRQGRCEAASPLCASCTQWATL